MAGAIGPGSIVQAVQTFVGRHTGHRITAGSLYCVERLAPTNGPCRVCGETHDHGLVLSGKKPVPVGAFESVFCLCRFRPWPPEPPSELLEEQEPIMEAAR